MLIFSIDLLQKSIPFALSLSKGARRKGLSALRQAQGERNDGAKTTDARGLIFVMTQRRNFRWAWGGR